MNATSHLPRWLGLLVFALALLLAGAAAGRWWTRHEAMAGAAPAQADSPAAGADGQPKDGRKVLYWYDPMQPAQHFDRPGKSPFMDMALQPRYADEVPVGGAGLAISTAASQSLGMRLATVERTSLSFQVEAVGTIELSERDISIVQSRTAGFVERVYGHAPGDVIAAGSPLVDVFNPDWAGAQQEFLAVRGMHDPALTQAARARLRLLGMSEALIERVDAGGQTIPVSTISAPSGGVITELAVRQGMTLAPGVTLARITGLATVWLDIALPEAQAGVLAIGQTVHAQLSAMPGRTLSGKVTAILPQLNVETRTLRVRVELANPGNRLRAGMFAQATLTGPGQSALAVPADAVIRTGKRALVYLAEEGGKYRPVEIEAGVERDGKLEVRSGLAAGQQVVASGQFLIDSEASMRGILPGSRQ